MTPQKFIPQHIAIIMDGNGRWANGRGIRRKDGHRAGAESIKETVQGCLEKSVKWLTLYAFSSENWNRPKQEIEALISLLEEFLKREAKYLIKEGIRLRVIGNLSRYPQSSIDLIEDLIEKTKDNEKMTLVLALSYGSREEIVNAIYSMAEEVKKGKMELNEINEEKFEQYLYTADIPDPDLLIRTSGEYRLSNFLLWQLSYAEFYFVKKYWPDFNKQDLLEAISTYASRQRRFGR